MKVLLLYNPQMWAWFIEHGAYKASFLVLDFHLPDLLEIFAV